MGNRLRVGNLDPAVDASGLEQIFAQFGTVSNARVMIYGLSGRSRGFGFVEMSSVQEAEECVLRLNGREQSGRELAVSLAPEEEGSNKKKRGAR